MNNDKKGQGIQLLFARQITEPSNFILLIGWTCFNPQIFQRSLGLLKIIKLK